MLRFSAIILVSSLLIVCIASLALSLELAPIDAESAEALAENLENEDGSVEVAESRAGLKGIFYQSPNEKINKHLLENEASEDARLNMVKIKELLIKETQKNTFLNKSLLEALRRLSELFEVQQAGNKCDQDAYMALLKNARAHKLVQKRRSLVSEGIPLRRIDEVVNQYSIEHAKDCENIYPIVLRTRYEELDKESTHRLEALLNPIIDSEVDSQRKKNPDVTTSAVLYWKFITKAHLVNGLRDGQSIYEALKVLAKHDPDSSYLNSPNKDFLMTNINQKEHVRSLLEKYLLKPCEYYTNRVGDEILIPALHDTLFYHDINESKLDFYYAFARFRLCQVLVGNHQSLTRILVKFTEEEE